MPHPLKPLIDRAVAIVPLRPDAADAEVLGNLYSMRFQDISILHYIPFHHFLTLLRESRLHLNRLDTYSDGFEALYPEANRHSAGQMTDHFYTALPAHRDVDAMFASQQIHRRYGYIHCWFEGSHEDRDMWQDYGDSGTGVCIYSTTALLQRAVSSPPEYLHFDLGRCFYRDEHEPIPELFSISPAFRKRRRYDKEQEIRLLGQIRMEHLPLDPEGCLAEASDHQKLPVDTSVLIRQIITGPRMTPDRVGIVIQEASRILSPTLIRPSSFDSTNGI